MCSSNGAHRVRRWPIIEKNAAATVDLQVDEAGRKHRSGRHDFGWPVSRTLIARRDALNHPAIDQDDRVMVPSISIESTVSRNCQPGSSCVFGWFQTHRLTSSLAGWVGRIDPLAERLDGPARSRGHRHDSGTQGANKRSGRCSQHVGHWASPFFANT
jgi:hypothetical protein